jgi:WSC domain
MFVHRFALSVFFTAMLSLPAVAQLQPGSTGGSIGKTDKSISGGEQTTTPRQGVSKRVGSPPPAATARYIGCFRDQQTNPLPGAIASRDLNGLVTNEAGMTSARCISVCRGQGFAYAGTQYGTYCFCGNAYGRSGAATNCNAACGGNPAEMCGGGWANSVYRVSR